MKCIYCNCDCMSAQTESQTSKSYYNSYNSDFNGWHCDACNTLFSRWKDKVYRIKIFFSLQEKKYVYYNDFSCALLYSRFEDNGIEYTGAHPILTFENPPQITPSNVKEKIKTYLTFL